MKTKLNPERIVYCSPYYDPSVPSGANRRFDEIGRRLQSHFGDRFLLVVSAGKIPVWANPQTTTELFYRHKNPFARIIAWWQFGRLLRKLPPSAIFNEFIPIPFYSLRQHIHFQVVYDLRYFRGSKSFLYRLFFSNFLKQQWHKSEYIVTCSEFTKKELIHWCGCDPDKMIISFFGIDDTLFTPEPNEKINDILFVGHFEWRKNHTTLLKALKLIPKPLKTILIGVDNGLLSSLKEEALQLEISKNITFDTINDDKRLWPLYKKSRLFVFPSLYEGFGIPLIESLALGTPVACSDIEIFHEVGQDFADYFNPLDPQDMAKVIERCLNNPPRHPQAEVLTYLKRFTWEEIAKTFIADIEKIISI